MAKIRTRPCPSITEHEGSASGDDGKVLWIREATTSLIVLSLGTSSFHLLPNARKASILSARYDPERQGHLLLELYAAYFSLLYGIVSSYHISISRDLDTNSWCDRCDAHKSPAPRHREYACGCYEHGTRRHGSGGALTDSGKQRNRHCSNLPDLSTSALGAHQTALSWMCAIATAPARRLSGGVPPLLTPVIPSTTATDAAPTGP